MSRCADRAGRRVGLLAAMMLLAVVAPPVAQARTAPLIAAAGDIACGRPNPGYNQGLGTFNSCQQLATSNLLAGRSLSAVLVLGDLQYDESGSLESYLASYDPTWGRWKAVSRPTIGNHEYDDDLGAQGYWDYWNGIGAGNGVAGARGRGWYAYDVGSWRLIALNSNCDFVACLGSSRQLVFLRNQLQRYHDRCVLAYMHHPRFSSGVYEERGQTRSFWKALYRGGADVVLAGHDHLYERFAPQRPSGIADLKRGVAQFTVGTGGYFMHLFDPTPAANSEFAYNQAFGVLFMRLGLEGYVWSFARAPSAVPLDGGSRPCLNRADLPPEQRLESGHPDGRGGGRQGGSDTGRRPSG